MIALTCAATSNTIYFNPDRVLVLESGTLDMGSKSWPVTRVWVGPGDNEYFPVKETPTRILEILKRVEMLRQYEH